MARLAAFGAMYLRGRASGRRGDAVDSGGFLEALRRLRLRRAARPHQDTV